MTDEEYSRQITDPALEGLADLLFKAKARFEAMTPDEQIHHRHEQRISFATGNTALSLPEIPIEKIREHVRRAAGPCPCAKCTP